MASRLKQIYLRYPKQFWLLVAGTLVNSLGVSLIFPFLTIYLRAKLDLPLSTITTLITMDAAMVLISSLFAGPLIDSVGRKWMMVIGSAVNGLAYLFMGQADSYWAFAVLMIIRGTFTPMFQIGADSMVADLVPGNQRLDAYSIVRVMNNLGFALGPTIGGLIASRSYNLSFMLTAASILSICLMVAFFMKETKPQEDMPASLAVRPRGISALGPVFKDSFFVKFLVVFTLIKIPTSMLFGLLPVYAKENFAIPESQVGLLMLTNGLTIVLLQYFVSSKVKRFDIMPILTVAGLFYTAGFLSVAFGSRIEHFLLSMLICTFGELLLAPTSSTLVANIAPPDMRGRYMSAFNLSMGIGRGLGPLTGGFINDRIAPNMIWYSGSLIALVSTIGYYLLRPAYVKLKESGRVH